MEKKLDHVIKQFLEDEGKDKPEYFDSKKEFEYKVIYNLALKRDYLDRFALLKKKYHEPIQEIGLNKRVFNIKEYNPGEAIQEFMVAAFSPDKNFILSEESDQAHNLGLLKKDIIDQFLEEE